MTQQELVLSGKICPYCGRPSEQVDSAIFYGGRSYGPVMACLPCNAYVGIRNGKALGRLASKSLREWKMKAHEMFDDIWKGKEAEMTRSQAYEWLSNQLNISPDYCHIGMFDIEQCKQVVEVSHAYFYGENANDAA